jgi:hypothetical protein
MSNPKKTPETATALLLCLAGCFLLPFRVSNQTTKPLPLPGRSSGFFLSPSRCRGESKAGTSHHRLSALSLSLPAPSGRQSASPVRLFPNLLLAKQTLGPLTPSPAPDWPRKAPRVAIVPPPGVPAPLFCLGVVCCLQTLEWSLLLE